MSREPRNLVFNVSDNNVHIEDSYKITIREEMIDVLYAIYYQYPKCNTFKRPWKHLISEWRTHNRLYKLGLWKSRTKDVDLNYPVKWYIQLIYNILGL